MGNLLFFIALLGLTLYFAFSAIYTFYQHGGFKQTFDHIEGFKQRAELRAHRDRLITEMILWVGLLVIVIEAYLFKQTSGWKCVINMLAGLLFVPPIIFIPARKEGIRSKQLSDKKETKSIN